MVELSVFRTMPIRLADESDWPSLIGIYNQGVDTRMSVGDLTHVSVEGRREWLAAHNSRDHPIYVEETAGKIVGWCAISPYRPGRMALRHTVEISYFVDEAHRRTGVATRLIDHALAGCKRSEIRRVFAILMDINAPSVALLEKLGFEKWGHLPGVAVIDGKECGQVYLGRLI
jgi:L-amino acid N-acyltransferase YncA